MTAADPLTPADCDLSDFPFMPLEVGRLRRSKAWVKAKRNPALGFYMVNLWTAAWHEKPAGSLEDDDDVLADAAMCDPSKWAKVRDDVLRGWVKCSDGRLYNPTVCEKVQEAWAAKQERREKDEHERERKRREREERARHYATLKEHGISMPWNAPMTEVRAAVLNLSGGQAADGPGKKPGQSRPREGQGHGEGQGDSTSAPIGAGAGGAGKPEPKDERELAEGYVEAAAALPAGVLERSRDDAAVLWRGAKSVLHLDAGLSLKAGGEIVGKMRAEYGDVVLLDALQALCAERPPGPVPWLTRACQLRAGEASKTNAQSRLEAANDAVGDAFLAGEASNVSNRQTELEAANDAVGAEFLASSTP